MSLQEKLKEDLRSAILKKNNKEKDAIRVILGEFSRLDQKGVSDEEAIKIIRKLQNNEKLVIGNKEPTVFLKVVETYLPKQKTKEEILDYILNNVDLSSFKNILQAMSPIMKGLEGNVSGQDVRDVLLNM